MRPTPRRAPSRTTMLAEIRPETRYDRTAAMVTCGVLSLLFGVFSVLCIGLQLLGSFAMSPGWAIASMFFALVLGIPHIVVVLWLDRNEPEPWWLLLLAWGWGAVMATGLSVVVNEFFGGFAMLLFEDPVLSGQLTASISAPIIEEITKGAALVMIYLFFRSHFDNVLDGIVYGAMVGMGFAMVENYIYYMGPILEGAEGKQILWGSTILLRGIITGVGTHWCFTAITGAGFGLHRLMRRGCLRAAVPVIALLISIFAHFAWNTFAGLVIGQLIGDDLLSVIIGAPIAVVLLQIPFVIIIVVAAFISTWHEGVLIRRYLADEDPTVTDSDEVGRLFPPRRRLAHSLLLLMTFRLRDWWIFRRRARLLVRLAFERWHMDQEAKGKDDSQAGVHARKVRHLRRMIRAAR